MDIREIAATIFQIVIIPLLTVLTTYAVKWLRMKADELKAKTENEYLQKYIEMLHDTIVTNVIAVNQTYVDALKEQDIFDKDAQLEAFRRVYDAVMNSLTEEAEYYLENIFGDLQEYITALIEAAVRENKLPKE